MSIVRFPHQPRHPERICWGCEQLCPASDMACSKARTMHPAELLGGGAGPSLEDEDPRGSGDASDPTTPTRRVAP